MQHEGRKNLIKRWGENKGKKEKQEREKKPDF